MSTKPKLRVGLIGTGFMGKTHVFGFATSAKVFDLPFEIELHTVADVTEAAALQAAADFGFALQSLIELGRFAFVLELLLNLDRLQRDAAADALVTREVDHSHGPLAEDGFNLIFTEEATGFAGDFAHLNQ